MPSTSRGYPYPSGSDDVDIPGDMQALAAALNTDVGTVVTNAATAQATANAAVPKASYDAHTVLAATTDNTPAAVTVGEQTIVGRKTGGNITALTAAEVKTLLGVTTGDVSGLGTAAVVDVPAAGNATSGQAVKGSDTRLTDARTPTAHKTSHQSGGSDEITLAQAQITNLTTDLSAKAPLASPTFTGVPAAPTAAVDTNTTQVATTAFTVAQIADDAVAKSAVGNLLTASQANPEGTTGFPNINVTLTNVADGVIGTNSLKVTATDAVHMLDFGCAAYAGDGTAPTLPGGPMTFDFWAKSADSSTSVLNVQFTWGDGTNVTETVTLTSAWKHYVVTKVAPSTGPYACKVRVYAVETIGDSWQIDKLGLWQGAGGQWQDPATGVPITDLGFYTDESVGRRLFQWDANNSRWQKTYADTGLRDTAVTVANSWTIYGGYNHIRRAGNIVSLNLWLDSTSASADTVGTIPSGFRPDRTVGFGVLAPGNLIRVLQISSGGSLDATTSGTTPGAAWFVQATWVTNEAWPTTLPGSAVGSIPA